MLVVVSIVSAVVALPAPPADAAVCTYDGTTKTVTLPAGGGTVSSDDTGGPPEICGETFDQIDAVVWPGTSGDDTFVFDVEHGMFAPSASSQEIKFQLDAGGGEDTVEIDGGSSSLTYHLVTGSNGVDLNGDGDVDATISNAEHLEVQLGTGNDVLDAAGGLPTGMDGMTVDAGAGKDTIDGSPKSDVIDYDGSDDTIDAGPGNDTVSLRNQHPSAGLESPAFDGGTGTDTLRWDDLGTAAVGNLADGTVTWHDASGTISGFENLVGGNGGDTLIGDDGANILDAGKGSGDIIRGNGGDDTFESSGSAWADYRDADGVSVDLTTGKATGDGIGTDVLIGVEGVIGSPGRDAIHGDEDHASRMLGEQGNDTISGAGRGDLLIGGPGNDDLRGAGGRDALHGGRGDDLMIGGAGDDAMSGGLGNDDIRGGDGSDSWNASLVSIPSEPDQRPSEGASVNLATDVVADDGFGTSDTISGLDDISGTIFADTLIGDASDNVINGSRGNDRFVGGHGDDVLVGSKGRDTVSFASSRHGLDVDLSHRRATGDGRDRLGGIEVVIGGPRDDVIRGSAADQRLEGRGSDDVLLGRAGRDALVGGPGEDTLDGGGGHDTCNGGGGGADSATGCETVWRVP